MLDGLDLRLHGQVRTLGLTTSLGREVMAGRVEDVRMNVPRAFNSGGSRRRRRARMRRLSPSTRRSAAGHENRRDIAGVAPLRSAQPRDRAVRHPARSHADDDCRGTARLAEALAEVPGIGPAKIASCGDAILTLVRSISKAPR